MRAWCTISIPKYLEFWRTLRQSLAPSTQIMAVVKANGYGLGAIPLAKEAEAACVVDWFGVATVGEGAALRNAGIQRPILLFSEPIIEDIPLAVAQSLDLVVYNETFITELSRQLGHINAKANVHLKIDTGMNRLGCPPSETPNLHQLIISQPRLKLAGVMTHLACADIPDHPLNHRQIDQFNTITHGLNCPPEVIRHAANSAATQHFKKAHFDMVRVGIDSYTSMVTLHARVVRVHRVEAGESISYGGRYITSRPTQIATVSIGYADGVPRSFSGSVLIHGQRCPVVSLVCMDLLMVEVGLIPVRIGDTATFVGTEKSNSISLQEYADFSHQITYESLTGLGQRITRKIMLSGDS